MILTVRCVPQGVTDLPGMQRLARLAERAKSLATRFARFGQHAVQIQTVLSNLKLPNPSMDLESIDSAISDLIKPRFFVFSPLCLCVCYVEICQTLSTKLSTQFRNVLFCVILKRRNRNYASAATRREWAFFSSSESGSGCEFRHSGSAFGTTSTM